MNLLTIALGWLYLQLLSPCTWAFPLAQQVVFSSQGSISEEKAHRGTDLFLSAPFFDFVAKGAVSVLKTGFEGIPFPQVDQKVNVPVLGSVQVSMTNLSIIHVQADLHQTTMRLTKEGRMEWHLGRMDMVVAGRWGWTKGPLNSHGSVRVSVVQCQLRMVLEWTGLTLNKTGLPLLHVPEAQLTFGGLQMDISDSHWSWLYTVIKDLFQGSIQQAIKGNLNQAMTEVLPAQFNQRLQSLPVTIPVWKGVEMGYLLTETPHISPKGMVIRDMSLFSVGQTKCPWEAPVQVEPQWNEQKMIQLQMDETVLNCLLWSLHKQDFFTRQFQLQTGTNHTTDVKVTLPLTQPRLHLLVNKEVVIDIQDLRLDLSMRFSNQSSSIRDPFHLALHLNVRLQFRLEVASLLRVSQFQVDFKEEQIKSTGRETGNWRRHCVMAVIQWIDQVMVPPPVDLPWPLNHLRIRDVGLHVLPGLWQMEADFGLDEEEAGVV